MLVQNRKRLHPLVTAAAVAIILVCLIALATLSGVLPPTQGVLVAAHAAAPAVVSARPVSATSPPTENKRLPALTVVESLAPGEALVQIDAEPVVAKPAKAASTKAALAERVPSITAATRRTISVATPLPASAVAAGPAPRIVPVYRDTRSIGADVAYQDGNNGNKDDRTNEDDHTNERAEPPAANR